MPPASSPAPAARSEPAPRLQAPTMPAQPAPQPVAQPRANAAAPQTAEAQQRLAGLDPKDRIASTRAEEEFFEIPAFLRRQAN